MIEASGGSRGLRAPSRERPDVIFLDLRMPDMLGTEVLARLKRNPATARIPGDHLDVADHRGRRTAAARNARGGAGGQEPPRREDGEEEIRQALRSAKVNV